MKDPDKTPPEPWVKRKRKAANVMFPNWTGWKTVKMVLFLLGGASGTGGLVGLLPDKDAAIAGIVLAAAGAVVVGLSGTGIGPAVVKS